MVWAALFAFAAFTILNATKTSTLEHWKYDSDSHRKAIYMRTAKGLAEQEAELGRPLKAPANWSLERFLDSYLADAQIDYNCRSPDHWTLTNAIETREHLEFDPDPVEDFIRKYKIDENDEDAEDEEELPKWSFKDFIEKYNPTTIWERINEESLTLGLNYSQDLKYFSLMKRLDATDELLNLTVPRSGRRWLDQWPIPKGPGVTKLPASKEIENYLFLMRQTIYNSRERMTLMQDLRNKHKHLAMYKMGFLFAKTDYSCKVFASLAFKFFRTCSMIRQSTFYDYRLMQHFMDVAHSIERLETRWFDVDILKDLLMTNDIIARTFVLKDKNLTTPEMVVAAFNKMYVD